MTDWNKLIEHADGRDCVCMAVSYIACFCDADWTPKEVYKLRQRVESLEAVAGAARKTIEENKGLSDGENCTLKELRDALVRLDALQDGKENSHE
jgi:hypothetical protein